MHPLPPLHAAAPLRRPEGLSHEDFGFPPLSLHCRCRDVRQTSVRGRLMASGCRGRQWPPRGRQGSMRNNAATRESSAQGRSAWLYTSVCAFARGVHASGRLGCAVRSNGQSGICGSRQYSPSNDVLDLNFNRPLLAACGRPLLGSSSSQVRPSTKGLVSREHVGCSVDGGSVFMCADIQCMVSVVSSAFFEGSVSVSFSAVFRGSTTPCMNAVHPTAKRAFLPPGSGHHPLGCGSLGHCGRAPFEPGRKPNALAGSNCRVHACVVAEVVRALR